MTDQFDAVVIGAGPGGSTAALLLARGGWRVAAVERKAFPRGKVCGEYLSATNRPLLENLGVAGAFDERAGPSIRRVGLFAGGRTVFAPLPAHRGRWGRALGRDSLDSLLLAKARAAGAVVFQPTAVRKLARIGDRYCCTLANGDIISCRVVIAAHGYWEPGPLPTQPSPTPPRLHDLIAFKAHFTDTSLPSDAMPLLAFPGGYGGMVHSDAGRVSLSCCVRRDCLTALRGERPADAGAAVLDHIRSTCGGVRDALRGSRQEGAWLAAGPLRPGIRVRANGGEFAVGNAAGEAHPVVAEGISMAMQSAWLLTRLLVARGANHADWHAVGIRYARVWRRAFAPRLLAASVFAHWAMRPALTAASLPLVSAFPAILHLAARLSGKTTRIVR